MARLKNPEYKQDKLRMRNNMNNGKLVISGNGKHTYLWATHDPGHEGGNSIFSGPKTLEKFARALLKALGKGDE